MDNFYLTLPCSVKGVTQENVLSDYITHLPRTIELEDRWEVALVEFHFNKSWYNLENDTYIGLKTLDNLFLAFCDDALPAGKYPLDQLITEINKLLNEFASSSTTLKSVSHVTEFRKISKAASLSVDLASNRIIMNPGLTERNEVLLPVFTDEFYELLGMTNRMHEHPYSISSNTKLTDEELLFLSTHEEEAIIGPLYSERAYDIERGIHSIFVYSDIVKENLIGDKTVQCLRVCTLPQRNFGETINLTFDQPHYLPLSKRSFSTIRVTLKDKTNEQIRFQFGETLVKLHFKKC